MTDALRARIEPAPTSEEAAAIVAALETLRGEPEQAPEAAPGRSRWRLAGLLAHPARGMEQENPLWSYTRGRT
jgi:hypothetical protein